MSRIATLFKKSYGAHPLHLLTMLAGFALLACVFQLRKDKMRE